MTKRLLDIFVSGLSLLVLLVPGLLVMLILRLTGEGNVFYLQPRVGKDGKKFKVWKFVTMRVGSESQGARDITLVDDPRVLPVGAILRKTKINELPQLINVFIGNMSLVGWRPLVDAGFNDYTPEIREKIVRIKPGLTGLGSIVFRDEESILANTTKEFRQCYTEDVAPYKGTLELWYQDHQSFWMDIKVLVCTALVVLLPGSSVYMKFFPELPQPPANGEIARIRGLTSRNPEFKTGVGDNIKPIKLKD